MRRLRLWIIALAAAAYLPAVPALQAQTPQEIEEVRTLLNETKERFLKLISPLDEEQWSHKVRSARHTVGEEAEHTALAYRDLQRAVHMALQDGKKPERAKALKGKEEKIKEVMLDPERGSERYSAHNRLKTKKEVIDYFNAAHERLLNLVGRDDADTFSQYTYTHPAPDFGEMTAFQWLYYIAYHGQKHCDQIEEILEHPDFPGRLRKTD